MVIGLLATSLILGIVQITIYASLPLKVRLFLCSFFILALGINLGLSALVALFTGIGNMVGMGNLGGSILFGCYMYYEKSKYDPKFRMKWNHGKVSFLEYNKEV